MNNKKDIAFFANTSILSGSCKNWENIFVSLIRLLLP